MRHSDVGYQIDVVSPFLIWGTYPSDTMATVRPQMYQQLKDLETGCVAYGTVNLEQCKQTFYLKQQNEILKQQQANSNQQQENSIIK